MYCFLNTYGTHGLYLLGVMHHTRYCVHRCTRNGISCSVLRFNHVNKSCYSWRLKIYSFHILLLNAIHSQKNSIHVTCCTQGMLHDMMTFGYKIPKCARFYTMYSVVLQHCYSAYYGPGKVIYYTCIIKSTLLLKYGCSQLFNGFGVFALKYYRLNIEYTYSYHK